MRFLLYNVTTCVKIGGVETSYVAIARELAKAGHEVVICSGKGDFAPTIDNSNLKLATFDFTPRERIFDLGNGFRKFGERVSFWLNARGFLEHEKFDAVVIQKPYDFFVVWAMKKQNPNLKAIFISGGEDFYFFDKYFVRYIDKIISVSNENAEILRARYGREVIVVPNGVDKEAFAPNAADRVKIRAKFGVSENETLFGSAGRVVGWKGFDLAIKAMKEFPECKYLLCGDGEALAGLKTLAAELGVEERVIFAGMVAHDELAAHMNAMDIYIQPSKGHEAFGITVIEALACDKPCVTSDNGGMRGIIENGVNGFKFENANAEDLVAKLRLALENRSNLKPRESIKSKYNWSESAEAVII